MKPTRTLHFTLIKGGRRPAATSHAQPSSHKHSDRKNCASHYSPDFMTSYLVAEARKQLAIIREKRNDSWEVLSAEGRNQIAAGGALALLEHLCTDLNETKGLVGTRAMMARGLAMIIAQLEGINGGMATRRLTRDLKGIIHDESLRGDR